VQKQLNFLASKYAYVPKKGAFYWNPTEPPLPSSDIEFLHYHNFIEIGFCVSGCGLVAIGEKFETVRPGDAMFVAPGVRHYSKSLDECYCRFVFLEPEKLPNTLVNTAELNRLLCRAGSQVLRGEMAALCERVSRAFLIEPDDTAGLERATALLCQLALELPPAALTDVDAASRDSTAEGGVTRDSVAYDAAAYMKLHYNDPLSVARLAELCHLSESRFRRRFAEEYGCTPYQYLYRLRAEIGAELLRRTQLTVSEVAAYVGFGCDSEFYRCFFKMYGMSPSAWRKM